MVKQSMRLPSSVHRHGPPRVFTDRGLIRSTPSPKSPPPPPCPWPGPHHRPPPPGTSRVHPSPTPTERASTPPPATQHMAIHWAISSTRTPPSPGMLSLLPSCPANFRSAHTGTCELTDGLGACVAYGSIRSCDTAALLNEQVEQVTHRLSQRARGSRAEEVDAWLRRAQGRCDPLGV
jgi:hypothetical protein